jgi:hypothetical protein
MTGGIETFSVPASDATALYVGDPVVKAGSADANGVATVTQAAAAGAGTSLISGIVVGFGPAADGTVPKYRAASTAATVLVCTDPSMMFEVQEDAVGGALAAADVGLNADIIVAAGSSTTGRSGVQLDTSTKATTATLPLKIMGFVQRPDNAIGANAKVLVKINTHSDANAVAGV